MTKDEQLEKLRAFANEVIDIVGYENELFWIVQIADMNGLVIWDPCMRPSRPIIGYLKTPLLTGEKT